MLVIYQAPFHQSALGFSPKFDYVAVWVEDDEGRDIDQVWKRFQRIEEGVQMPPDGYTGRSLSVGDVVNLRGEFFTPTMDGWSQLTDDEALAVEDVTREQVQGALRELFPNA